jgi:hypothetical protein
MRHGRVLTAAAGGGYRGRMRIRIGHELVFEVPRPTAILLMLYAHPDATAALEEPSARGGAGLPVEDFVDWFGNRAGRLIAPAGTSGCATTMSPRGGQPEPASTASPGAGGRAAAECLAVPAREPLLRGGPHDRHRVGPLRQDPPESWAAVAAGDRLGAR